MPDVAASIFSLADLQQARHDFEAAGKNYQEAVQIYRELARIDSRRYMPDLTKALNILANLQQPREYIMAR